MKLRKIKLFICFCIILLPTTGSSQGCFADICCADGICCNIINGNCLRVPNTDKHYPGYWSRPPLNGFEEYTEEYTERRPPRKSRPLQKDFDDHDDHLEREYKDAPTNVYEETYNRGKQDGRKLRRFFGW